MNQKVFAWIPKKLLYGMTKEMTSERIRRFNTVDRLFHLFLMLTFLIQSATGFSRLFFPTPWERRLARFLVAMSPRSISISRSVCDDGRFVIHTVYLLTRVDWQNLPKSVFGPDSLVPNLDDARNLIKGIRWFFGFGPKPTFYCWTYWKNSIIGRFTGACRC